MKVYSIDTPAKKKIYEMVEDALNKREEILFAYLHGSFLENNFQDIDIGIYVHDLNRNEALRYELSIERELEEITGFPVDVRVINYAPLSFRFDVIKHGVLLFSKDERKRSDFECLTLVGYHDFKFYRDSYRREAIGIGVR